MFVIVEIAGQQFKVAQDQQLYVNRLAAEEGATLKLEQVLLANDANDRVVLGTPYIDNASVQATVVRHVKADKVLVFHKKRRKGYRKFNGHRQQYTKIQINAITF
jgi:large subunit ribosomal protein L21